MKKIFSINLALAAIFILTLGWADVICAASDRAPISGTPLLREQKRLLLRDYGPAARIQAERAGTSTIRADVVGDQPLFWAHDFGTSQ